MRIKQHLQAETDFVISRLNEGDKVLEPGCGYGRIIPDLLTKAGLVFGIDNSYQNILYGKRFLHGIQNCVLMEMDAAHLSFPDHLFDAVICVQNGISALKVEPITLIKESIRVTKPGGKLLFSTYSPEIWDDRLEWFRLQAAEGLLGEIDKSKTRDGIIVCRDGFTATTLSPDQFLQLAEKLKCNVRITEVDGSAIFFEIRTHSD